MRFSLQDMVRQTLAEAEEREKTAQLQQEPDRDEKKEKEGEVSGKPTSKETSNTPERNYESLGEKTSSVFVEKLASAVEFLNSHFLKEAVGKPEPAQPHTPESPQGAGKGQTALETDLKSPPGGGGQRQSETTGEAHTGKPPMHPGHAPKSPGMVAPETALETDIHSPPGGSENWTHQDKMKQAGAGDFFRGQGRALANVGKSVKNMVTGGSGVPDARKKALKAFGENLQKAAPTLGVAGTGTALALGQHGKNKKAEANFSRILGIMDKMAGEDVSQAHITGSHHDSPPEATKAEEGVPKLPGEASRQERFINSNEAARDYTKGQAKAVPKERMGEVIDEPAQKKSTDPVLHQNLDATPGAGVKISSAEQSVAARALLRKIAEEGAKEDASPEEKERAEKLHTALKAKQAAMPLSGGY